MRRTPRHLVSLTAALVACLALPIAASAVTGVAFVHGKGGSDLAGQTAANNYWTADMIKTTTKNYTIPYVVAHYDGTLVMWDAANQVAGQLHTFITTRNINDLVIETHSFGGIVVRWMMSNPTYDSRYPAIIAATRWVNSIAAPQKGSEAANMAGTLSGSWLTGWIVSLVGQDNPSTRNCRTADMAYYNTYYLKGTAGRPALPKPVYWISGWGLWNDYWTKFHSEDFGLATLSGVVGMPGEDDGMVSEYSAQAVGTSWFRTEANHHHNRRNDYKKIGASLATDF